MVTEPHDVLGSFCRLNSCSCPDKTPCARQLCERIGAKCCAQESRQEGSDCSYRGIQVNRERIEERSIACNSTMRRILASVFRFRRAHGNARMCRAMISWSSCVVALNFCIQLHGVLPQAGTFDSSTVWSDGVQGRNLSRNSSRTRIKPWSFATSNS